jgi:cholesterol oxidase
MPPMPGIASTPSAVQFTEKMRGFISLGETAFEDGHRRGEQAGTSLMFELTIRTDDVDQFASRPDHLASATGYIDCPALGGRCDVERGLFNLFVETASQRQRKMLYRLFFRDSGGRPLTLTGFKNVQDNLGPDIWKDTTTLYVNILDGHIEQGHDASSRIVAAGILRILPADFIHQMTTFKAEAPDWSSRTAALGKFGRLFAGGLWDVYAPSRTGGMGEFEREIPLYTTEGVRDAEITTHPFQTGDKLGLSLLRFLREPCDDVVIIIHGLTTSSDMFIMPEHENFVQHLLDHGYTDVWTLDFRMSNRFSYNLHRNRHNMDDIALYDYPAALKTVRAAVGHGRRVHVVCHCLGSVSFMMSLFGKAVDGITSVISNSVSLTLRVKTWSRLKLTFGPFFVENLSSIAYLNPYWRREPGLGLGKMLAWVLSLFHRECNSPECHMLSFMWGTGFPAVYKHENLLEVTHRRGGDLYGGVSLHYYRHVRKMVRANNTAVKFEPENPRYQTLPDNYLERAADITTPVLFMTGEQNDIFLDSNIICYDRLNKVAPGRHEKAIFPEYGHQDVFMGKNCHIDIFPRLLDFLDRKSGRK